MAVWAGIVRVSFMGERKAGEDSTHTDRDQVADIQSVVPAGDALDLLPAELNVSGGLPLSERPSLSRAVAGVEDGTYAGIILAYQSRLFRNVEEEEAVFRRVEEAGGEILFALDGIDNKTASGRLIRRVKGAINTGVREEAAEQFERRCEKSTAAGIWQRRQTPRGYAKDPETRKLVPNDQAAEVAAGFARFSAGQITVSGLAREWGMTPGGIRHLLRNRVYLGELRVRSYVNPEAHPAIVDVTTFEAVQASLASTSRPPRQRKHGPALLAGLVRCAGCGHVMTRAISNGGFAYACRRNHSGGRCPTGAAMMATRLDPFVEAIALAELDRLAISATEGSEIAELQAKVSEAQRELDAYLEAVSPQDVGAETFRKAARGRRDAVNEAQAVLREAQAREGAMPDYGRVSDQWGEWSVQERNTVLRHLLESVIVSPAGRGQTVPVERRVRVVRYGTGLTYAGNGRGGSAGGIVPVFPDADDEGVLGMPGSQDSADA